MRTRSTGRNCTIFSRRQLFPLPKRPKIKDEGCELPDDFSTLSNVELGQLMGRFASWLGYGQRLLGLCESELLLVESEYRLKVNAAGVAVREELGRVSQDVIADVVLERNEDLTPLYKRKLELTTVKVQLESRLRTYERAWNALSRELSRRELEAKIQ